MTVIRHPNNQGVTLSQWRKTAAGGETSVSGTDDFSAGLAYTAGAEQVFVNGVLLERGVDYTASTGTTVTGLTALVAGDIVTVSSPSAFNVANAIPKATITAKGDLLVGTGASTPTNLGVGADGTTLVANSSAATGMSWTGNQAAGKNAVLNGDFGIWQRGTTSASITTAATYSADRWSSVSGASTAMVVSRQATGDTTNLPNIQYCARVQKTAGQTGTNVLYFAQSIESINSIPFAGKTVTLSFYARKGANYSSATSIVSAYVQTGTGTDQNILSGGLTGAVNAIAQDSTLTTTWQRFTYTGTIGTTATQIGMFFSYAPVGTAGAADYFEVTGVQLELGAAPTTFTRAGGTLQGELAACQRYYQRSGGNSVYVELGTGYAFGVTGAYHFVYLPVSLRVSPTSIDYSTLAWQNAAGTLQAATITAGNSSNQVMQVVISGLTSQTTGQPGHLITNNSTSGYLGFNAEL